MSEKILLVEDEAILALSESKMLEKHGYEVVTIYSGEQALEAVDSDPEINLILMDIDLGEGMSGTEAAQKILRKYDLPIVFLSSHTEPEVVKKTEGITSYGYIVKNSGETVLLASIKMAFKLFEANERIAQSEKKHRTLFETMSTGVVYHDANGSIISVNPASEKLLGLSFNQMKGKTSMDSRWKMITEEGEYVPGTEHPAMVALRTGNKVGPITRGVFVPEKENYVWLIINATPLFKPGEEKPFQVYATFENITDRKMVEKAYQESKEKYRAAFMTSPDSVNINRIDGLYVDINEGFTALTGYTREDVIGKLSSEIDIWSIPEDREILVKGLKENGEVKDLESVFRCKDGSLKTALMSARFVTINDEPHILSVTRDITRSKKLKEEANKAKRLLETISDIAYETDTEGNITYVNSFTEKITGLSREELIGTPFIPLFVEDDRDSLIEVYRKALEGQSLENTLTFTTGVICHFTILPRYDKNGNIIGAFGVGRDITERKKSEKALLEKTEMLNNVIENISDLVVLADVHGYITFHSNLFDTFGYGRDSLIGRNVLEFVHPEDLPEIEANFTDFINNREDKRRVEYRFRCADDSFIWMETDGKTIKDEKGNIKKVIFSARDITDRKNAQEAIKKSEEKYRLITENAYDIIVQVDEQLKPTYISPSAAETLGYTIEEIGDANVLEYIPPDDQKNLAKLLEEKISKNERKLTHSHRIYTKSGEIRWMETRASLSYDDKGHFNGATYVDRDVTDIKKLEQENKDRRQLLEAILEATPNAIITFDSRYKIDEWNRGAEELFHYTREEVLDCEIDEIVVQQDKPIYEEALSYTHKAVTGESVPPTETVRFTKEGEPIPMIVAGSPIMVGGVFKGVVASYTDISRLKQKEKEVEILLEEKEHLLHEVHHRIKNHMSTISSIISLRASHVDKPQIREVLEEVQGKVNLMQNIYQSLYTGEDVGTIRISSYLEPVLHDIQYAYIDSQSVAISTDIEEIEVTSKQSFPVGIIITELITNSIKYAFYERGEGKIHISIHKDKKNTDFLCIEVSDNGKGMPCEIVEKGEYGFGLTLVEGYAKQFDGSMRISAEGGTRVRVVLELE